MTIIDEITDRLRPLADALAADGGRLEVSGLDGTTLRLLLALEDVSCQECVLPDHIIEQMAIARLDGVVTPPVERTEITRSLGT